MVRKLLKFVIESLKLYDYIHGSKSEEKKYEFLAFTRERS